MTAFVPGFQNDLFISYAHEDDKRWVQAFEDELRDEVSRRLGTRHFGLAGHEPHSRRRELAGRRFRRASRKPPRSWRSSARAIRTRSGAPASATNSRKRFKAEAVRRPAAASSRRSRRRGPRTATVSFCRKSRTSISTRTTTTARVEFTPGSRDFKRAVRKLADGVEPLLRRMRRGNQRVHVAWPVEECLDRVGAAERRAAQQGLRRAADGPARRVVRRQAADAGHGSRGPVRAPARIGRTTSSPSASRCSRPISSIR